MAESREELKSLLLRLKESERASLKLRSWHLVPFSSVAQSCPTLSKPMDCSLPGSSTHGIFQARVLEWVAIAFSASHILKSINHRKSKRISEEHVLCFTDYIKAFDCVDHNKLWKILQDMGIPDCLTCLLRNLYASQEATDRTKHGTIDWF